MLNHGSQAVRGVECPALRIQGFVRGVIYVDQDQVKLPLGWAEQTRVYVALNDLEPRVGGKRFTGGEPTLLDPCNDGVEEFDYLDSGDTARGQGGLSREPKPESAHQNGKIFARVHFEGEFREASFGLGVIAAHEEALIQGDLGDDHSRAREKLAPPET